MTLRRFALLSGSMVLPSTSGLEPAGPPSVKPDRRTPDNTSSQLLKRARSGNTHSIPAS